jgi:hypothetical protein
LQSSLGESEARANDRRAVIEKELDWHPNRDTVGIARGQIADQADTLVESDRRYSIRNGVPPIGVKGTMCDRVAIHRPGSSYLLPRPTIASAVRAQILGIVTESLAFVALLDHELVPCSCLPEAIRDVPSLMYDVLVHYDFLKIMTAQLPKLPSFATSTVSHPWTCRSGSTVRRSWRTASTT